MRVRRWLEACFPSPKIVTRPPPKRAASPFRLPPEQLTPRPPACLPTPQIKRSLLEVLSDEAYNSIQSFHSDSAVSFALFLHHLPNLTTQHPPEVLLKAMQVGAGAGRGVV